MHYCLRSPSLGLLLAFKRPGRVLLLAALVVGVGCRDFARPVDADQALLLRYRDGVSGADSARVRALVVGIGRTRLFTIPSVGVCGATAQTPTWSGCTEPSPGTFEPQGQPLVISAWPTQLGVETQRNAVSIIFPQGIGKIVVASDTSGFNAAGSSVIKCSGS